jgi:NADH-quinone oxidoreductase subunit K
MIPMSWYLILAAGLFSVGLFGVLARRNAVAILMGIELMLNAVNLNLVTFWRYRFASTLSERLEIQNIAIAGQVFVLIVLAVAAAEAAVGLALIISIYRRRSTVAVEEIDLLKW